MDDGSAAVLGVLAAIDERVLLEVACDPARRGEREAELPGELADGARLVPVGGDVDEHRDVARADRRIAFEEATELRRRTPSPPEAAQHRPERPAQLFQLGIPARHCLHSVKRYHSVTIIQR